MGLGLAATLAGLALIDSTSIGTLFVPIALMLVSVRVPASRMFSYLAAIAVFYWLVGVVLTSGLGVALDRFDSAIESEVASWVQLGIGLALLAASFWFDPKRRSRSGVARTSAWLDRVSPAADNPKALAVLAVTAGAIEVATMLPYLGAIALIGGADLSWGSRLLVLAAYCLVMVLPAVVLYGLREAFTDQVTPLIERLNGWFARHAVSATGWVLGIAGFLVARDAAVSLGFLG